MKKDTTHSALLGLTQIQMAALLKVHPSQWSMYESGQRDLPHTPTQVLAEMLSYLQLENKSLKVKQHRNEQEELMKNYIEKLLSENEYQLQKMGKKLALAERKYHNNIHVIGLIDYLAKLSSTEEALDRELLKSIASKAESDLKKSGLAELTHLRIKEELLQQEKIVLHSKLNKMS